ncbi:hypothetical protein HGRIS_010720 [Hohenbuehelia grisea]|uniref:Uncharacterized protein n=1 Tax=Hohenbuehelia grisea TaxID=104357 RepID=A0ABR3IXW0_9AGAR
MLRTYAIWGRKPAVRSLLITLCIVRMCLRIHIPQPLLITSIQVIFVPALVITQLESASLSCMCHYSILSASSAHIPCYTVGPSGSISRCNLKTASSIVFIAYILLVICETTIVVLTAIKAYQHLRHTTSSWIIQLYRDGFYFYIILLGFSLANILVPVLGSKELVNWLATPQRVAHSLLCTRILFLIFRQRASLQRSRISSRLSAEQSTTITEKVTQFFSTFFAAVPSEYEAPEVESSIRGDIELQLRT